MTNYPVSLLYKKNCHNILRLCICLLIAPFMINIYIVSAASAQEPYEVVIENLTLGQDMPDLQAVEQAVNKITVPAINCTVKIENINIASHESQITLMLLQDKKMDLINTGRTVSLSKMVDDNCLLPLNNLLEQYGQTLLQKNGDLLNGCVIKESIYAVPATQYCSSFAGFIYNELLAEKYNIDLKNNFTVSELETAAEKLRKAGIYLLSQGDGNSSSILLSILNPDIIPVGNNQYLCGVILGSDSQNQIINLFESEKFLEYCRMLRKWNENGWLPQDSIISGLKPNSLFQTEKTFMMWTAVNPVENALQAKNYNFSTKMIANGNKLFNTNMIQESGWGIFKTSERPDKAMEFLNFIYENSDVSNLLMNGLENKEYKKISDHIVTYADGVTAETIGYSRNFSIFGDLMEIYQWSPATEEFYSTLQDFYDASGFAPYFGYTFDITPVSSEYSAVSNILACYLPPLECGMIKDVDSAVRNMNDALNDAGIHRIISENQSQLNNWLTKHEAVQP